VFRLGELQGLARWHPGAAEVGAAPGALTGAQDGAERALLLLTKLRRRGHRRPVPHLLHVVDSDAAEA